MPSLEALPPDQRAVVQLVLQQGRSYEEIAALLGISVAAVRDRARSGVATLGGADAPGEREAVVSDWLLGQAAVPTTLEDDADAQAFATRAAEGLAAVPGARVPDVPRATSPVALAPDAAPAYADDEARNGSPRNDGDADAAAPTFAPEAPERADADVAAPPTLAPEAPERDEAAVAAPGAFAAQRDDADAAAPEAAVPVARPDPAPVEPDGGARPTAVRDAPWVGPDPDPRAPVAADADARPNPSRDGPSAPSAVRADPAGIPRARDARASARRRRSAPPEDPAPSSRVGGAVLLAALLAVLAAGTYLYVQSRDDAEQPTTATAQPTPTPTGDQPQAVGQIDLRAVGGGNASGVMTVFARDEQVAFTIEAERLRPNTRRDAYAVWFTRRNGDARRLGYAEPVGADRVLGLTGPQQADLARFPRLLATYDSVVVSRETRQNARRPGTVVLRGPLPS